MTDALIPGLSDPALAITFGTFEDVTALVAPKDKGIPLYAPNKIALTARRLAGDVTMGQLLQICGDAIDQGDGTGPPDLWEINNTAVAAGGEPAVRQLAARRALLQSTVEFLWRSTDRGGLRGAAGLLLLPTVRREVPAASASPPVPAETPAPSETSPAEAARPIEAASTSSPTTPETTGHIHHQPSETATTPAQETPSKRARLQEATSSATERAGAGSGLRGAEELPMLTDVTIRSQGRALLSPVRLRGARARGTFASNPDVGRNFLQDPNGDSTMTGEGDSRFRDCGLSASSRVWGVVEGQEVHRIDLDTAEGFGVSFTTYGATLASVRAGDREGEIEEVTLQHDTLEGVVGGDAFYGSTIGRVCNRIAGANFSVDGETFALSANNGPNCLHGGVKGFDKALWRHDIVHTSDGVGVSFELDSHDKDGGFPGHLAVKVTYSIRRGVTRGTGELHSKMEAVHLGAEGGNKKVASPVNLTNHAYWNLSGNRMRSVRDHGLLLRCDRYLPLDDNQIPTGELALVHETAFDFSEERSLGSAIDSIGGDPPGLDHCLVCVGTRSDGQAEVSSSGDGSADAGPLPLIARLRDAESGRVMEVFGSQPAAQVYTSNFLPNDPAVKPYARHYAVCLETQHFPDAVNRKEWAESVLLQPGATYLERSRHVFTVDGGGA